MSHFQTDSRLTRGEFTNKFSRFEYRYSQNEWGLLNSLPHEIATCDGTRCADIRKTVAYVAIDKSENGLPVLEKWAIKHLWKNI